MTQKKKIFKYTRPVEQMGIAITYGGLDDIFKMMDDKEMEKAVTNVIDTVDDKDWDLLHKPNNSGLGGVFILIWKE